MNTTYHIKKLELLIIPWIGLAAFFSQITQSFFLSALFSAVIFAAVLQLANKSSSVHIMYLVGYSTFAFFPALLNGYYFDTGFEVFYATSLLTIYFLNKTKNTGYMKPENNKLYYVLFISYSSILVASSISSVGTLIPYIFSPCVMFYALCLKNGKIYHNTLVLLLLLSVFLVFTIFEWGGYGRTVVMGNLIVAVLYFMYANNFPVSKVFFSIAPAFLSTVLIVRKSLTLGEISLYEALNDSAFGPYRLADTFIDNYIKNGMDISGFLNQVLFSFTPFIPRDFWPGKPYGFGFEYVVKNMDQSFVDSGHSVASTLIGDHIYFLGWLGILSGFLMLFVVAKLVNILYRIKFLNGHAVIIFSCNMMVLLWGGMTSLSARIIFPLIGLAPLLLIYIVYRQLAKSEMKYKIVN